MYLIFGTGGMGREAMEISRKSAAKYSIKSYFVEDNPKVTSINGIEVIKTTDIPTDVGNKFLNVAIGDSKDREEIYNRLMVSSDMFSLGLVSEHSMVYGISNSIMGMSLICPFASVTVNNRIGKGLILNTGARIAHDCIVGDWVTIAPNAVINGWVEIEDHVFIGSGAVIRNGSPNKRIRIGRGAFIGMGQVITRDVEPGERIT